MSRTSSPAAWPKREAGDQPFEESATRFSIQWSADFEIEGDAFVVVQGGSRVRTILGYPVGAIAETMALLREDSRKRTGR